MAKKKIKKTRKVKKAKRVKRLTKKVARKKVVKRSRTNSLPKKKPVKKFKSALKQDVLGEITHYFPKVRAAVVVLKSGLALGDKVRIKGHTTDFSQVVTSIQIDHVPVNSAKKGDEIGLLVDSRVRDKDIVYKG